MLIEYKPFPQATLSESTGKFVHLSGCYFYALMNSGEINNICYAHFCEHEKCENIIKFYRCHEWNANEKPKEVKRIQCRELSMVFIEK